MASAKTLYWVALAALAVSFGSSNLGRDLACKASSAVDHLVSRSMPYVAAVEIALGRTQAAYGHLQANAVRVKVEQARLQAAQARLQAEMAREQLKQRGMLNNERFLVLNRSIMAPDVVVDGPNVRVNTRQHVMVCPETRGRVAMPNVPAPQVNVVQDPI